MSDPLSGGRRDWTANRSGRSNSSALYLGIVAEVEQILRGSGPDLVNGRVNQVARLIVSRLAHVHGLAPLKARDE